MKGESGMITLAIDFSTERRSVCVTDHSGREATAIVEDRKVGALSLIGKALTDAGIDREEVELIAVGLGPGSYTGIRAAIATAQGWHLGTGVKLAGISSVDLMARSVVVEGGFAVVVDAQRGEFYCARYLRECGTVRPVSPLEIVGEVVNELAIRFSPEPGKVEGPTEAVFPDPKELARMALAADEFVEAENLTPIYLREVEFKKAPPAREIH